MINKLIKEFKEPSCRFRSKPFWAWNGNLDKDELLRQIDILKEMGFDGYFMHSRVGLQTEYLGDEWFDLINSCADYGESVGMESYLYDEDRWPSGTAGGMITQKAENQMRFIEMTLSDSYKPVEDEIISFACVLTDNGYDSCRVLGANDTLNTGESAAIFKVVTMRKTNFYNGFTYADTMRRETTDEFIASTHKKYKNECGQRMGSSIKGIFTDEPHHGALFSAFSEGGINCAPYTEKLFPEFQKRFGYDLKERLAELFLIKEIRQVKWHYCELIQALFLENFLMPICEWCEKNNMILTGHVVEESSLSSQAVLEGSIMRLYEYMHVPGMDLLTEGNKSYWIAKQLSSVARQLGKDKCLSELYGATGWQMSFMSHKTVGDWQALFGVNERCHHLSWYTMEGEAKRDYPASILHQSAWYKDYKYVEDYFERLNYALSIGKTEQELLVIYPIESVTAGVYSGCFTGLRTIDDRMMKVEQTYKDVFYKLAGARIDFDYGDEDILKRHATVEGNILKVGNVAYKKVLVAGMDTIRSSTVELLDEFINGGGEVILCGGVPTYIDALPDDSFSKLAYKETELSELATVASCGNEVLLDSDMIYAQTRNCDGARVVVLLNVDRENEIPCQSIRLGQGKGVFELDCRTGEKKSLGYETAGGYVYVTTGFYPGEEKVYVVCKEEQENKLDDEVWFDTELIDGEFDYELTAPNICVLDKVTYTIDGQIQSDELEVLAADRKIRDQYGLGYRGGAMLQPWYATKYGDVEKTFGRLCIRYEFEVEQVPEDKIELVSEYPQTAELEINGFKFDASPCGKWIDVCFNRYEIPDGFIKKGINEICVTLDFCEKTNLEAMYLLGDFGVDAKNGKRVLKRLPEKLGIGDISCQGLPFYSDRIIYKMYTNHSGTLMIGEHGGACVKANGNLMGFAPYRCEVEKGVLEIELVLTRRNTFGPLHQFKENVTAYAPGNFVTVEEEFSDDYQLIRQGILNPPLVKYEKESFVGRGGNDEK